MPVDRILLSDVLRHLDEKMIGDHINTNSIAFVSASGEIISLDKATKVGVKLGMNTKHYIGLRSAFNNHHSYTVHMRSIITFNNKRVAW